MEEENNTKGWKGAVLAALLPASLWAATISGTVTSGTGSSAVPINNALVTLLNGTNTGSLQDDTTTNAAGAFTITNPGAEGQKVIVASHPGYNNYSTAIAYNGANITKDLTLAINNNTSTITGQVIDASNSAPVDSAIAILSGGILSGSVSVRTNVNGVYTFDSVGTGTGYQVAVSAVGYASGSMGNIAAAWNSTTTPQIFSLVPYLSIVGQPHDTTVALGFPASFGVSAQGLATVYYQWLKNGMPILGATASTYSLTGVSLTDTGSYSVITTDTVNSTASTKTSSAAKLVVATAPILSTQPLSVKTAAGGSATFTVVATGGTAPLTYQWRKGSTNFTDSVGVSGSKTPTLSLTGIGGPDSGSALTAINVVVTSAGLVSVTSSTATLTVNALPQITAQPTNFTEPEPQDLPIPYDALLSVVAGKGVEPLVYQWRKGSSNLTDGGEISGSKTAKLMLTNFTAADTGKGLYSVVVTNADSVGSVASTSVGVFFPTALSTQGGNGFVFTVQSQDHSVRFGLPEAASSGEVVLMDIHGCILWTQNLHGGQRESIWNGTTMDGNLVAAGIYIARMTARDNQQNVLSIFEKQIPYTP